VTDGVTDVHQNYIIDCKAITERASQIADDIRYTVLTRASLRDGRQVCFSSPRQDDSTSAETAASCSEIIHWMNNVDGIHTD
jgi:hypothetical protein